MKSLLFIFSFIFLQFQLLAQDADIIGNWEFSDLESESMDENQIGAVIGFFKTMNLNFTEDKTYISSLMGVDEFGTYSLDKTELTLTSDAGILQLYDILEINDNILKLGYKDVTIVMSNSDKEATALTFISVEKEKLIGSWKYSQIIGSDGDVINNELDGSYLSLKKNGKFKQLKMGVTVKGEWLMSEDETAIYLNSDTDFIKYMILEYSDESMTLYIDSDKSQVVLGRVD